jgi:hypothetical protein
MTIMDSSLMCGTPFSNFFNGTILPIVALSTIVTATIIALTFMASRLLSNPKLSLWAKTEIVQLFISVGTIFIITTAVSAFCAIDMAEVNSFFLSNSVPSMNVYDSAFTYISNAVLYTHNAVKVVRYHLEGYTVLTYFNAFQCDFTVGRVGLGCLFGYSGENVQPFGGYGAVTAALNMAFNSVLVAHFTALNFMFILLFVYRGFVFLFLPMGVFLRAMPYMRSFGSLLVALALSFLLVYPFMLAVFNLMSEKLLDSGTGFAPTDITMSNYDESIFPNSEGGGELVDSTAGEDYVYNKYFGSGKDNVNGALAFAAYAFIAGVFFPTLALLATMASVSYMARLYGEEIDLSRITQLV